MEKTYLPQSGITQYPLIGPHPLRHRPTHHHRRRGPHDPPGRILRARVPHELRAQNCALPLRMAIDGARHVFPERLDVRFDGGRCIVEAGVGAEGVQARMVLGGGDGDEEGGGVQETGLLDYVHTGVCGRAVDEELCGLRGGGC